MKQYIQPQTREELAQCDMMLAASLLDQNIGNQNIIPSDEEYNGMFAVKPYVFGDDF